MMKRMLYMLFVVALLAAACAPAAPEQTVSDGPAADQPAGATVVVYRSPT